MQRTEKVALNIQMGHTVTKYHLSESDIKQWTHQSNGHI